MMSTRTSSLLLDKTERLPQEYKTSLRPLDVYANTRPILGGVSFACSLSLTSAALQTHSTLLFQQTRTRVNLRLLGTIGIL